MTEPTATEVIYCKHGRRGDCPACGRVIVMRWPCRAIAAEYAALASEDRP